MGREEVRAAEEAAKHGEEGILCMGRGRGGKTQNPEVSIHVNVERGRREGWSA